MASVVSGKPNAQRRREVLMELCDMDIDDEFLTDVLKRVRERKARIHPLAMPRPNPHSGADPTKRHMDDPSRSKSLYNPSHGSRAPSVSTADNNGIFKPAGYQSTLTPHLRKESHERGVFTTHQGVSSAIGSNSSLPSGGTARKDQVGSNSSLPSGGTARKDQVGSNSSLPTGGTARTDQVGSNSSLPSGGTARKGQVGSNSSLPSGGTARKGQVGSNSSLPSGGTARNKPVSKPNVNQSTLNPKVNKKSYEPAGREMKLGSTNLFGSNSPRHSQGPTSNKQVSKPAGNHSKAKCKIWKAGHVCAGCVAKQNGSSTVGMDVCLDSQNTARNKVFGIRKLFQRKTSQQRHTCAGCGTEKGGRFEGELNSASQSQSTECSSQSPMPVDTPSKSKAIPKESVTRKIPGGKSPSVSSSNTLSNKRHASHGPGGAKAIVPNSTIHSKDTARSKHTFKSRGIQSLSQGIRNEGVARKSPEKFTSVKASRNALSNLSLASLASTKKGSKDRDAGRSGAHGHGEAAKNLSPRDSTSLLLQNATNAPLETLSDSLSTMSLLSGSRDQTTNAILSGDRGNLVYPGDRYAAEDVDGDFSIGDDSSGGDSSGGYSSGDYSCGGYSSEGSHPRSSEVGKVVDSVRSTARDILSTEGENVKLSKPAPKGIDALIDRVCDKMDELDDTLFRCEEKKKEPPKRWLPRLHVSFQW